MNEQSNRLSIDGPLFRRQRERLISLADAARSGRPCEMGPEQAELLEGLVGLTDAVAVQSHDRHGLGCRLD